MWPEDVYSCLPVFFSWLTDAKESEDLHDVTLHIFVVVLISHHHDLVTTEDPKPVLQEHRVHPLHETQLRQEKKKQQHPAWDHCDVRLKDSNYNAVLCNNYNIWSSASMISFIHMTQHWIDSHMVCHFLYPYIIDNIFVKW